MPTITAGTRTTVTVEDGKAIWVTATGNARYTIGLPILSASTSIPRGVETRIGYLGTTANVDLICETGSLSYQDSPSVLVPLDADSSAAEVATAVNGLLLSRANQQQTVVLFGDSYAETQNFPIENGNTTWFSLYRFILGRMGNSVHVVKNAGISGNRANQMLARINTDVMPFKSDWVFFNCGVNDFFEGDRSVADVSADVSEILRILTADGRKVLAFNCPPQVSTRSGFTSSKSARVIQYNRWLVEYAATLSGVVVADIYSAFVNWSDTTNGGAVADFFASDGVHLSTYGEIVATQAAFTALNGAIGAELSLFNGPLDLGLIGTKSVFAGTGGSNGVASSGQVATGYTSQRTSGTSGTIVASKLAQRGQRQTVTLIAANGEVRLRLWSDILTDLTPHFGKTVRTKILMRLRTTSGGVSLKDFSIRLNNIAGGVTTEAANGNYPTVVYAPITDTQFDTGVILVTLRDFLIPVGTTQAQLLFGLLLDSVAGGVVELDLYGADIREVV